MRRYSMDLPNWSRSGTVIAAAILWIVNWPDPFASAVNAELELPNRGPCFCLVDYVADGLESGATMRSCSDDSDRRLTNPEFPNAMLDDGVLDVEQSARLLENRRDFSDCHLVVR